MKDDIYYTAGRCHLFALAAAKTLGYTHIKVLWDVEPMDDDLNEIGRSCLVHAFLMADKDIDFSDLDTQSMLDVNGVGFVSSLQEYPCNEAAYSSYSIKDFVKLIIDEDWERFEDGEEESIKNHILNNPKKYYFLEEEKNEDTNFVKADDLSIHQEVKDSINSIDAAVINGDAFLDDDNREIMRHLLKRWETQLCFFDRLSESLKE